MEHEVRHSSVSKMYIRVVYFNVYYYVYLGRSKPLYALAHKALLDFDFLMRNRLPFQVQEAASFQRNRYHAQCIRHAFTRYKGF